MIVFWFDMLSGSWIPDKCYRIFRDDDEDKNRSVEFVYIFDEVLANMVHFHHFLPNFHAFDGIFVVVNLIHL